MKKKLFAILMASIIVHNLTAQLMQGWETSPYSIIYSAKLNPASLANSPYRLNFNILGAHTGFDNNLYSVSKSELFKLNIEKYQKNITTDLKKGMAQFGTVLPSFMLNVNESFSIALISRYRKMINVNGLDANTATLLGGAPSLKKLSGKSFINDKASFTFNSWFETGLSAAYIFQKDENILIKGGLSIKYLKGISAGYIYTDNLSFKLISGPSSSLDRLVETKGKINYGFTDSSTMAITKQQLLPSFSPAASKAGIGIDAGIEIEWPDFDADNSEHLHYVPHRLKVGLGISDFGSISYNNNRSISSAFNITNTNTPLSELSRLPSENMSEYTSRMQSIYKYSQEPSSFKMHLPLTANAYADWKVNEQIYFNVMLNAPLSKTANGSKLGNAFLYSLTFTPRFESMHVTAAIPISINSLKQVNAGVAMRLGPIIIGSGSILTNLFTSSISHANIFAGINIGLKRNKKEKVEEIKEVIKRIEFSANNVYFEAEKSNLLDTSLNTLDSVYAFLKKNPGAKLIIEGHTDASGSKENNLFLSQSRADQVVKYLTEKGIDEKRLTAIGYGDTRPIADNNTPEGKSKNRRVTFQIINMTSNKNKKQ